MDYVEAHEKKDDEYTHVFLAEYIGGNTFLWRKAVCGFIRGGTFLADTASEDYPICPVCNRWLILVKLGE